MADKPIMYLTRTYAGVTPETILKGVLLAAREENLKVFALHGGQLDSAPSFIYDNIEPDKITGLITWASPKVYNQHPLYEKFVNIPAVSLSVEQPKMKAVIADNIKGTKDALLHLIKEHNRDKILFLRGPEGNATTESRFQAYKEVLQSENIPFDERRVSNHGRWESTRGVSDIVEFIDNRSLQPGKDFDSVICINDKVAIGVMEELKRRKINIPETVSIICFNNSAEAKSFSPPITAIALPFIPQGYNAVKTILDLEKGRPVERTQELPASLSIRQSCGCISSQVESAVSGNYTNQSKKSKLFKTKDYSTKIISNDSVENNLTSEQIISTLLEEILQQFDTTSMNEGTVKRYIHELLDTLIKEISDKEKGKTLAILTTFISYLRDENLTIDILQELFSKFRFYLGNFVVDYSDYLYAEDFISQARVQIAESSQKDREKKTLDMYSQTVKLQKISSILMTIFTYEEIFKTLASELPGIGINGVNVCLYDNDLEYSFHPVLGDYANRFGKTMIPAKTLYPDNFVNSSSTMAYTIHSLHFRGRQYGHIIYDIGTDNGIIYNTITEQLSSTIYSIKMREENNRVKSQLQEVLNVVDNKVEVVSESSTSINNGVQEGSTAMEEIAANIKEISKNLQAVTSKIDLSVKQINDTNSEVNLLMEETKKIESIVSIISDIAERTKLLSFNASIEAARAGNAGKGFSIVSKEVKNLAYSTISSAENIRETIDNVQKVTKQTSESVLSLKDVISQISDSSMIIDQAINEQSSATGDLSQLFLSAASGTEEISEALLEIKKITKINI